ncbi:MAG: thiol:disulfide interchange protein DsbA/DsbL [Betaproteobacteria bacterium]
MTLKNMLQRTVLALLAALALTTAAAQTGPDFVTLKPPQPVDNDGKIEVLEFFAYGCPHCAVLEPRFNQWVAKQPADVKIKRIPAVLLVRGIDSVPLYYTLEAMGMEEKLHQKIFDAANVENVMLGNPAVLLSWLEKQGVDPKKYEEMQKSFSVTGKIARGRRMSKDYQLPGTPTLVINGRYILEQVGSGPAGEDRLFATADRLIAEARASVKAAAAKPAAAPAAASATTTPEKKK